MSDFLRLPKEGVEDVLKRGGVVHSPLFSLKFLKNSSKQTRFSVVVSKKIDKTAVGRNLIKRKIREISRNMFKNKGIFFDMVVLVKKKLTKEDYSSVMDEICRFIEKTTSFDN